MAFTTFKRRRAIAVLVALLAALALTLVTLMVLGRGSAAAHPPVWHPMTAKAAVVARDTDTAQVGNQSSPDLSAGGLKAAAMSDPAGSSQAGGADTSSTPDPAGNSQAGGPDTGTAAGESSVDSEQGQPGEPAVGHADPAGSGGSDCTGNCVQ
jgi:hypothetical protein